MTLRRKFGPILTTVLVVCALIAVQSGIMAQALYVSYQSLGDVYRFRNYIENGVSLGEPYPLPGQSGAFFAHVTDFVEGSPGWTVVGLACGRDGNLYIASQTLGKVFRYDATTGEKDPSWQVNIPYAHGLHFAPDGFLYAASSQLSAYGGRIAKIDVATQKVAYVLDQLYTVGDVAFDSQGRGYVNGGGYRWIKRYDTTGTTWVEDPTFTAIVPETESAEALAVGPDDKVYVTNHAGKIYRFDTSGAMDAWVGDTTEGSLGVDIGPDGFVYVTTFFSVMRFSAADSTQANWYILRQGDSIFATRLAWSKAEDLPPGKMQGQISLANFSGDPSTVGVKIQLRKDGKIIRSESVAMSGNPGSYSMICVPAGGPYEVLFDAGKSLQRVESGVMISSGQTTSLNVTLENGDYTGDNSITSTDITGVLGNLDKKGD